MPKKIVKKQVSAKTKKEVIKKKLQSTGRKAVKKEGTQKQKEEYVFVVGKRKRSIARASIKRGSGVIKINSKPIDAIDNDVIKLLIKEPLIISNGKWKNYDFNINVHGGGMMGQAEAVRQTIARGLVEIFGNNLKQKFLNYDRNLLVYDPRRTEPHKPPRSSQGPRRAKQKSKR